VKNTSDKIRINVKREDKKRGDKMQNKPIWKILTISIVVLMVVSGIVVSMRKRITKWDS
jgi:hypothetical protein